MGSLPPVNSTSSPLDDATPVMLTKATANRFRDATRYYERQFKGGKISSESRQDSTRWVAKVVIGGSPVGAASTPSTPTPGSGTLCDFVSGVWTSNGVSVTVYNPGATSIASGAYVTVNWVEGIWEVVVDPC